MSNMPVGTKNNRTCLYVLAVMAWLSSSLHAQVDNIASRDFSITVNGVTATIPYASNHPVGAPMDALKYAVIALHGANRNADEYYSNILAAANIAGEAADSTLFVAPQFLTEGDINAYSLGSNYLYWSSGGWIAGSNSRDESSNPRDVRVPSYTMMDSMITRIVDMDINFITFVGHSAGGQFAQRHAASSGLSDIQDAFDLRYIVMNPSSYVYMDNQRRVSGTVDQFEVPSTSCSAYNEWKYGLDDLFTYPDIKGASVIRESYKNVRVIYLLGENDNDPNSGSLDSDCEATLQGAHRLERGTIFFNHLNQYYDVHNHVLDTVPGVAHNHAEMFASSIGRKHLFEDTNGLTLGLTNLQLPRVALHTWPNPVSDFMYVEHPFETGEVHIEVMDVLGRSVIFQKRYVASKAPLELSMGQAQGGVYLIVLSDGMQVGMQKIIKE